MGAFSYCAKYLIVNNKMVASAGFEPTAFGLGIQHSILLSYEATQSKYLYFFGDFDKFFIKIKCDRMIF